MIYDRLTSIFFTHRNHAWWHINDQILHYEPTSWPSKQVVDVLLFQIFVWANFDYLPLIKNTCDISGADLFKFPQTKDFLSGKKTYLQNIYRI